MNRTQYVNMYRRLAKTRTQYTECLKITRMDGVVFRFTAHDKSLNIMENDGVRYDYLPANSFQLTALENQIGLVVSNMDIKAIIDDDSITEDDLIAGLFNHANFELFIAYWSNTRVGTLPLRTSWVGELAIEGGTFTADLRGIAQKLAQTFVHTTSLECRWRFCDSRCGLNAADFTTAYTVSDVYSKDTFRSNISSADYGTYQWGLATFTSGSNIGLSMEVIRNHENKINLFLPMPYEIGIGDTLTLIKGCDKTYTTCDTVYSNMARFGGEPFLTGSDLIVSYPQSVGGASDDDSSTTTSSPFSLGVT